MSQPKKYYIRLDGSGRKVAGSGVIRNKKPSIGRWAEEEVETCCVPVVVLSDTPTAEGMINISVALLCDDVQVGLFTLAGSSASSLEEIVALLNTQLGFLGTFSVSGTDIVLDLLLDVAQAYCPTGTLTLAVSGTTTTTTSTTSTTTV